MESASGFLLIAAAALGLIWANSPFAHVYDGLLHAKIGFSTPLYGVRLSVHAWVDDALMAVFFLLVGLEIKRELLVGELSSARKAALPGIAALGGMAVPALVCAAFVWSDPQRAAGWAIPAATDIAFALAALALLGSAVPPGLKVYLTALAVIDDLGAIAIIAIFYTADLVLPALLCAIACAAVLVALNRLRVTAIAIYLLVGVVMWFCVLESGVHATLAGVTVAFAIPLHGRDKHSSPLKDLEHALHPFVAYLILPLFGLLNAGVSLAGVGPATLLAPLPLGIACGLFFGKQIGIFACSWLAIKSGLAHLPKGLTMPAIYGVALLGGIGFTMSLFIGGLAFTSNEVLTEMKIGVFAGSGLSAVAGYLVLRAVFRAPQRAATES